MATNEEIAAAASQMASLWAPKAAPTLTAAEKLAAMELLQNGALRPYLLGNSLSAERASLEEDLDNHQLRWDRLQVAKKRLANMPQDSNALGNYADCSHNWLMIESTGWLLKALEKGDQLTVAKERTALMRAALSTQMPAHRFANHNFALKTAPEGLDDKEELAFTTVKNAVEDFVVAITPERRQGI